jgi:putrescine aminotransferase
VRDLCIQNGLMVRAVHESLVMSPPLVISRDEIDTLLEILRRSLDQAEPQLRALETPCPQPEPASNL